MDHTAIKFVVDPQSGVILDANNAAAGFTGRPREQLTGLCLDDYICDSDSLQSASHALASGRFHYRLRKSDNTQRRSKRVSAPSRLKDDRCCTLSFMTLQNACMPKGHYSNAKRNTHYFLIMHPWEYCTMTAGAL